MPRPRPRGANNPYGWTWQRLRPRILARDHFRCHWCGGRANTVDHVRALADGGPRYEPGNLVAACARCNSSRGGTLVMQRALAAGDERFFRRSGDHLVLARKRKWQFSPAIGPDRTESPRSRERRVYPGAIDADVAGRDPYRP